MIITIFILYRDDLEDKFNKLYQEQQQIEKSVKGIWQHPYQS